MDAVKILSVCLILKISLQSHQFFSQKWRYFNKEKAD